MQLRLEKVTLKKRRDENQWSAHLSPHGVEQAVGVQHLATAHTEENTRSAAVDHNKVAS
jgi:hypothetical protein